MVSEVGLSSQSSGFNSRTADLYIWGIGLEATTDDSQSSNKGSIPLYPTISMIFNKYSNVRVLMFIHKQVFI